MRNARGARQSRKAGSGRWVCRYEPITRFSHKAALIATFHCQLRPRAAACSSVAPSARPDKRGGRDADAKLLIQHLRLQKRRCIFTPACSSPPSSPRCARARRAPPVSGSDRSRRRGRTLKAHRVPPCSAVLSWKAGAPFLEYLANAALVGREHCARTDNALFIGALVATFRCAPPVRATHSPRRRRIVADRRSAVRGGRENPHPVPPAVLRRRLSTGMELLGKWPACRRPFSAFTAKPRAGLTSCHGPKRLPLRRQDPRLRPPAGRSRRHYPPARLLATGGRTRHLRFCVRPRSLDRGADPTPSSASIERRSRADRVLEQVLLP